MKTATMPCRCCGGSGVEPDPADFGRQLREARTKHGYTLRGFAKKIKCSAAFLSDVEHGRRGVSSPTILRALKVLGL